MNFQTLIRFAARFAKLDKYDQHALQNLANARLRMQQPSIDVANEILHTLLNELGVTADDDVDRWPEIAHILFGQTNEMNE